MGEVLFYHLTTRPLEQAAPAILEKCVERAWKVTIRCGSPKRVAALDWHLWTYRDEGVFHEHFANLLLTDLVDALSPKWCRVEVDFNARGGIGIKVLAEHGNPPESL